MPFVAAHPETFHCTHHPVIPKSDLYFTFLSTSNTFSKGRFTRSNFWSQLLLKLKEINDSNKKFDGLKQNHKNIWIQKMDRVV